MENRPMKAGLGIGIGIAVTLPAACLGVWSGGAGHGDYVLARLFFPYTMLLTLVADDTITPPLMLLALVQLPFYGAGIGLASEKGGTRLAVMVMILLCIHATAAVLCFSGLLPNFEGNQH
jgi:hypothetical protein